MTGKRISLSSFCNTEVYLKCKVSSSYITTKELEMKNQWMKKYYCETADGCIKKILTKPTEI